MRMITNKAFLLTATVLFASLIGAILLPSFTSAYSYYPSYGYSYPYSNSNNTYHTFAPYTSVNTMPIVNVNAVAQASATSNGYPYSSSYYPSNNSQQYWCGSYYSYSPCPTYNYNNYNYGYDYYYYDSYNYDDYYWHDNSYYGGGGNCYSYSCGNSWWY